MRILSLSLLTFLTLITLVHASPLRTIIRIVDGDTIILDGKEKVRLIGVDCPELNHPNETVNRFAKEATLFVETKALGKKVTLKYDFQRKDRYGRTLAYVYFTDGTMLNALIIKEGYCFAYVKYPFNYMELFRGYEREAREHKRGLWKG